MASWIIEQRSELICAWGIMVTIKQPGQERIRPTAGELSTLEDQLRSAGYAFVPAAQMDTLLMREGVRDWNSFVASWDDLGVDGYMADGGRYRRRRHAAFAVDAHGIRRKPPQPHYQSRDYNPLNGGIARWFEPVTEATARHPAMTATLRTCFTLFDSLTPNQARPKTWHVEAHQFRIEPRGGEAGQPTPEGMHRDGVDWVLVLLIGRENITSGVTFINDQQKRPLGSFTLTEPMDAAFVDDSRVYHGVTPVTAQDPERPAHRDVLVVTFRRE